MTVLALTTTVAHREDALRIGRELVDRGLVACAQLEAIDSLYRWQGAVQQEPEVRLVLKTTAARVDEAQAVLRAMHPYELPAIHAVVLDRVDPAYAAWVDDQCRGPG